MRVAILTTGQTERLGLGRALGRLFPGHEFYCLPTETEVQSNPAGYPCPGFTSVPLTAGHEQIPPESATELVSRAAQEALGDRRREPADLVVVIDDVEPLNIDRVDRVVSVMRRAVMDHLEGLQQTRHLARTREALREKVSFHLIAPMIEGWFFADRTALTRAGMPGGATVHFGGRTDPEAFVTDDARYLAATERDCPVLAGLTPRQRKKARPKWLGTQPRERHPKGYLQWLCREPANRTCTTYAETEGGCAALSEISWASLLGRPDTHFSLLRALVDDLEAGLNTAPSPGIQIGTPSPLTAVATAPRDAVLRNI